MDLVLQIVLVLVILGSFFLAYLSWKTWSPAHVVLVMLVFLSSFGFLYLAMRTLKTHQAWRTSVEKHEAALAQVENENVALLEGTNDENAQLAMGIKQLKLELQKVAVDRGQVWYGVAPGRMRADGTVQVDIAAPEPHGLTEKMIVFAFEAQPYQDGGKYLGEFKVTAAPDKSKAVELTPNLPLSQQDLDRLNRSKGPWTLYAMMPIDNPEVFLAMTEQERQALLPAESLAELSDPNRAPRDYELLFRESYKDRALQLDAIDKLTSDIARTDTALQQVAQDIAYRGKEKSALEHDLKGFANEREAVTRYAGVLQQQLQEVSRKLQSLFATSHKLAGRLTAMQLKLADQINKRSSAEQARLDSPTPPATASTR